MFLQVNLGVYFLAFCIFALAVVGLWGIFYPEEDEKKDAIKRQKTINLFAFPLAIAVTVFAVLIVVNGYHKGKPVELPSLKDGIAYTAVSGVTHYLTVGKGITGLVLVKQQSDTGHDVRLVMLPEDSDLIALKKGNHFTKINSGWMVIEQ